MGCGGGTGNPLAAAWTWPVACEGVPGTIMRLPIKYMHTTVELGSLELMQKQAHLLCEAVCELHEGWEETLCF